MESIFQETWNIKKIEKNELKTGDYSSFKITKIYFQKKSLCYFFGQRLQGTLPKYAPTILSAIDYPVYWALKSYFLPLVEKMLMFLNVRSFCAVIYQWDFFLQMVRFFASHQWKFHLNSMYGRLDALYGSNNVKIDKEGFPKVWNIWKW